MTNKRITDSLEEVLRKEVIEYLNGHRIFHQRTEDALLSNYPDIILCYKGHYVGVELKRNEKTKARLGQLQVLKMIRESGGYGEVIGSLKQLEDLFTRIDKENVK